jgi:hypothetical protein
VFDEQSPDRGAPSSLRGWLSDVYIPSLLDEDDKTLGALAQRLGSKATVDDPIFGRASGAGPSGLESLERYIGDVSKWLKEHSAKWEKTAFTTGVDRDVTEGTLALTFDSKTIMLPAAIVAERRRSREVELRVYYSTHPIKGVVAARSPLVPDQAALVLPPPIGDHIAALEKGDVDAVLATFEADGVMREARGMEHAKAATLRGFYEKLVGGGGVTVLKGDTADDGRTCALEYTLVKLAGRAVPPQAGLAVYERGDSGLLRSVRVYDDLESGS